MNTLNNNLKSANGNQSNDNQLVNDSTPSIQDVKQKLAAALAALQSASSQLDSAHSSSMETLKNRAHDLAQELEVRSCLWRGEREGYQERISTLELRVADLGKKLTDTALKLTQAEEALRNRDVAVDKLTRELSARLEVKPAPTSAPVVMAPNPKGRLQEYLMSQGMLPTYTLDQRTGPDHAPTFLVKLTVNNRVWYGIGNSRAAAEGAAATNAYRDVGPKDSGMGGFNPYGNGQTQIRGAAVLCIIGDRVLSVRERPEKKLTLPGGAREHEETPYATLCRELDEEGFHVEHIEAFFISSSPTATCVTALVHSDNISWNSDIDAHFVPVSSPDLAPYVHRVIKHAFDPSTVFFSESPSWTGTNARAIHPGERVALLKRSVSMLKDDGQGGFNPYGNGQTSVTNIRPILSGAVRYQPDPNDAVLQNAKWRAFSTSTGLAGTVSARSKVRFSYKVSGSLEPSSFLQGIAWVVMVHDTTTVFPSYSSRSFQDNGHVTGFFTTRETPATPATYGTMQQYTPTLLISPWIEPNADGVWFGNKHPHYFRMGIFNPNYPSGLPSYIPISTTEVDTEFEIPTAIGTDFQVTVMFFFNTGLRAGTIRDWMNFEFTACCDGITPGTVVDFPIWSQVGNDMEPYPLATDHVVNLKEPVWVTTSPIPPTTILEKTTDSEPPTDTSSTSHAARQAAVRNKVMHALNGNTMSGPRWRRTAPMPGLSEAESKQAEADFHKILMDAEEQAELAEDTAVQPVSPQPVPVFDDKWFEAWTRVNKWPLWAKYLYQTVVLDTEPKVDLPDADFVPEVDKFNIFEDRPKKPRKPMADKDSYNKAHSNSGRSDRIKSDDEKRATQRAAEERQCAKLQTRVDFYLWVIIRRPAKDWAARLWNKLGHKSQHTSGLLEAVACAMLEREEVLKEYVARWLSELTNTQLKPHTEAFDGSHLDEAFYLDDQGYSEWQARMRNRTMHALVGNTTYWDAKKAEDAVYDSQLLKSNDLANVASMFGAGYTPVMGNQTQLAQNTYLVYSPMTAGNAIQAPRALPSFTRIGQARTLRPPAGGAPVAQNVRILWRAVAYTPGPTAKPDASATALAIEAQIMQSKALNQTWGTSAFFAVDIHAMGKLAGVEMQHSMVPLYMKSHLYRMLSRYDDTGAAQWFPKHEFSPAFANSIVIAGIGLTWDSPAFDENCGLVPGPAAQAVPVFNGGLQYTMTLNLAQSSIRPNAQTLVFPYQLANAFASQTGKALAMFLMVMYQYPFFIPALTIGTSDVAGANAQGEQIVPTAGMVHIPGMLTADVDIIWPSTAGVRLNQINVGVNPLPAALPMHGPTTGPTQFGAVAVNTYLNFRGQGALPANHNYNVANFVAGWLLEIQEVDWIVFQQVISKLYDNAPDCALAYRYAQWHSSSVNTTIAHTCAFANQNLDAVANLDTQLTIDPIGRSGLPSTGAGNVTGAGVIPPPAHYLLNTFSIEYWNARAVDAVLPIKPSHDFNLKYYVSAEGWLHDLATFRRMAAAGQAWHHAMRISSDTFQHAFDETVPGPVVTTARDHFVSHSAVPSPLGPNLIEFYAKATKLAMGVGSVAGPLTAMIHNDARFMTPVLDTKSIAAYVPDIWMYNLIGPAIEWSPPDPPNTAWRGQADGTESWFPTANGHLFPSPAEHRMDDVPTDGYPLDSKQYIGNFRMLFAVTQQAFPAVVAITCCDVDGLNAIPQIFSYPQTNPTVTPYPWDVAKSYNCISYVKPTHYMNAGSALMLYHSYLFGAAFNRNQLQRYIAGNDQVNVDTIQLRLTPAPGALFNGKVNRTIPGPGRRAASAAPEEEKKDS